MKQEFKILTIDEENKLTKEELKEYYNNLRDYISKRTLTNTSKGATTIAPRINGLTRKMAQIFIKMFNGENIEVVCDGKENIPTERVIFVHTIKEPLDRIIWAIETDRHCLLLQSKEENELLLLCQLSTGLISINKENEINRNNAKLDTIRLLLEGQSISCFVESDETKYDFLEIAQKAGVAIIPVVHEYKYNTSYANDSIREIHSLYGNPMYISESDNLYRKKEEYEEIISNMQLELAEAEKIRKRRILNK